jgi:hypothetical protein
LTYVKPANAGPNRLRWFEAPAKPPSRPDYKLEITLTEKENLK